MRRPNPDPARFRPPFVLSYAQAMLMRQDAKVLTVAMDSGFGSLSAFNKSFRKLAGMSPSDFRRVRLTAT